MIQFQQEDEMIIIIKKKGGESPFNETQSLFFFFVFFSFLINESYHLPDIVSGNSQLVLNHRSDN